MSSRAQSERSEQPPEVDAFEPPPAALLGAARSPGAALLALQRTAGNRAVQRLVSAAAIARRPGRDTSVSPIAAELEARAKVERDIQQFEATLGRPLSTADREEMARALSAPRPSASGHSLAAMALTGLQHPVKTAEHMGPKAAIPDKLSEERSLLERFPRMFPDLVRFFASTDGTLPTVNVQTLSEFQFEGPPLEAYNVFLYQQARSGEAPMPRRVDVTPSMFGDEPQDVLERSLLLGPFNVLPQRVHLPHEPGYEDGTQLRLRVWDTLGLGEGQEGLFYAMSFVVGEKDVVLADYLATVDGSGKVEIKPWSERYDPPLPPQRDAAGNTFEL